MFKECDYIDFKRYIQLYKLHIIMKIIIVIWKGKTYKYDTWLYRLLHVTDSKTGNTNHKIYTEYHHVDWQIFTNNFSHV